MVYPYQLSEGAEAPVEGSELLDLGHHAGMRRHPDCIRWAEQDVPCVPQAKAEEHGLAVGRFLWRGGCGCAGRGVLLVVSLAPIRTPEGGQGAAVTAITGAGVGGAGASGLAGPGAGAVCSGAAGLAAVADSRVVGYA